MLANHTSRFCDTFIPNKLMTLTKFAFKLVRFIYLFIYDQRFSSIMYFILYFSIILYYYDICRPNSCTVPLGIWMYSILDDNYEHLSTIILNSVILTPVYYACCTLIVKNRRHREIQQKKNEKKNLPRMLKK